jgi:hypothetical protein
MRAPCAPVRDDGGLEGLILGLAPSPGPTDVMMLLKALLGRDLHGIGRQERLQPAQGFAKPHRHCRLIEVVAGHRFYHGAAGCHHAEPI